jgi:hypothetical protein
MRSVALLAVAGAVMAGPAQPVVAAPRGPQIGAWHRMKDPGALGLQSDGSRYVVTLVDRRGIEIHDSVTNRDRAFAYPPCTYPEGTHDPQPPRHGLGRGLVAWQCTYPQHAAIWVDRIRSARRTLAAGLAGMWQHEIGSADGGTFTLASVGRHWVYAIRNGYHYTDDILVSLDEARVVLRPADRADATVDPDAPAGVVELCAGIRRSPGILDIGAPAFLPLQYAAPYGVLTPDARTFASTIGRLRRCAGAPAVHSAGADVQLGGGLITWAGSDRAYAQSAATGRRSSRRAPGSLLSVAHTRDTVYVTVRPRGKPNAPRRYYRAHLG